MAVRFMFLVVAVLVTPAIAQETNPLFGNAAGSTELSGVTGSSPTQHESYQPENFGYETPKQIIRRKADEQGQQRRMRIAASKWYGLSNSRPIANPIPSMGTYSPMWAGSSWNPYLWVGRTTQIRVIRPATVIYTPTPRD